MGALIVMGVSTLAMAALPTYAQIGLWSAGILAFLRILQGLAIGAQWGGAVVLASEYAPPHRRGLYAGLVQLAIPLGLLSANAVFLLLEVGQTNRRGYVAHPIRVVRTLVGDAAAQRAGGRLD